MPPRPQCRSGPYLERNVQLEKKEVLCVLTDQWADWEASYALAEINSCPQYTVKTIAIDNAPKVSIGGLRAEVDYTFSRYPGQAEPAMIILPGGFFWGRGEHPEIADFVRAAREKGTPVAAICGATIFLAKHGFLNDTKHTGDERAYFLDKLKDVPAYTGKHNFISAQVVVDNNLITANETAAVDFANEIFRALKIDTDEEIAQWHQKYTDGFYPQAT